MSDPILISVNEAMERLGVGRSTLYALMGDKKLPHVHIGRRRLIPVHSLNEFVETLGQKKPSLKV